MRWWGVGLALPAAPGRCRGRQAASGVEPDGEGRRVDRPVVVVPVHDGNLTDRTLEEVTTAVRAGEGRETVIHCASGNRIGGALIPYLMIHQGFSEDDATMAALRMGLRGAHLLQWGLEYARRQADKSEK